MGARFSVALSALMFVGCMSLDGFVYNPTHCSKVGPSTCERVDEPWDRLCVHCEREYEWAAEYPWMPETLAQGQTVRPIPAQSVTRTELPTADGAATVDVYEIKGHGERADIAQTTIVYNHGNKGSIEHYLHRVRLLYELGFNVVVWDYRGFGKSSEGAPTGQQLLADADQVLAWARGRVQDPARVIVYGYSLGAVPTTRMAESGEACAMLLEAPWTSLERIAMRNATLSIPDGFLSSGSFDNIERASRVQTPSLVMIGDADTIFPLEDVEAVYAALGGPKELWVLPGVRHGVADGGVPLAGFNAYADKVMGFLKAKAPSCLAP